MNLIDPFNPNDEQLAIILQRANLCLTDHAIASELATNSESLNLACGPQIAAARHQSNLDVLQTMKTMANSGKNYSATLFWIKTHCRDLWKLESPKDSRDNAWNPNAAASFKLNVYNNDGEPNYDY